MNDKIQKFENIIIDARIYEELEQIAFHCNKSVDHVANWILREYVARQKSQAGPSIVFGAVKHD